MRITFHFWSFDLRINCGLNSSQKPVETDNDDDNERHTLTQTAQANEQNGKYTFRSVLVYFDKAQYTLVRLIDRNQPTK